jgi:hypothetical protein
MSKIKLGVIREGKVPPDKRVPMTPQQCKLVQEKFPHVYYLRQGLEMAAAVATCPNPGVGANHCGAATDQAGLD